MIYNDLHSLLGREFSVNHIEIGEARANNQGVIIRNLNLAMRPCSPLASWLPADTLRRQALLVP